MLKSLQERYNLFNKGGTMDIDQELRIFCPQSLKNDADRHLIARLKRATP